MSFKDNVNNAFKYIFTSNFSSISACSLECNGKKTFRIDENKGKVTVKSNVKEISNKIFDEPLQSMTSHIHMQSILDKTVCLLPPYEKVYKWHSKILTLFNDALGIKKGGACPIT